MGQARDHLADIVPDHYQLAGELSNQLPHLLAVTAVLLLPAVVLERPVSVSSVFRIFFQQ